MKLLPAILAAGFSLVVTFAPCADPPSTSQNDRPDTSSDFLSDNEWRKLPREERRHRSRAAYIARFEPTGQPTIDRLQQYVSRYVEINVFDKRLAVTDIQAQHVAGTTGSVELSGEVAVMRHKSGIETTMRDLGFNVVKNDIVVLPDAALGQKRYGVARILTSTRSNQQTGETEPVCTVTATVRKEPRLNAEQVDSVMAGDYVRLLREARAADLKSASAREIEGKWYLGQTSEGYVGFVRDDELHISGEMPQPAAVLTTQTRIMVGAASCFAPVGAYLYKNDGKLGTFGGDQAIAGSSGVRELKPAFTAEQVLAATAHMMGTRYEWGGITEHGVDCSGLTQFVMKNRGIFLPRDAEEQSIVGRIVAFGGEEAVRYAQPGDLVFFLNDRGKINHVGVSLGGNRLLHSSGRPGVHETTLQKSDDEMESGTSMSERVLWVRRVLQERK